MLKGGGQLLPGWGHGFAVAAPGSKELNKMGTWSEEKKTIKEKELTSKKIEHKHNKKRTLKKKNYK